MHKKKPDILLNQRTNKPKKLIQLKSPPTKIPAIKTPLLSPLEFRSLNTTGTSQVTIVIPTLQLVFDKITSRIIHDMCKFCNRIEKILIINNAKNDSMTQKLSHLNKVVIVNDLPNMVVNPAWNYGISQTKSEYYCLLNDDIVFNPCILDATCDFLDKNKDFNITTYSTVIEYNQDYIFERLSSESPFNPKLVYEIRRYPESIKQGWFIFGRTNSWKPIETQSTGLVMNGDDWVLQRSMESHGKIILIRNNTLFHLESTTVHASNNNKSMIESISKPLADDYSIYETPL